MRPIALVAASVCAAAVPFQASAAEPITTRQYTTDERQALAAVDRFFEAMHNHDVATWLTTVIPEGLATGIKVGEGPQPFMRSWHWATYIENTAATPQKVSERLLDPEVKVERDLAMVWGRYDFSVDGSVDHCGVDHFELVRKNGKWFVYNLTWTNQKVGCSKSVGS